MARLPSLAAVRTRRARAHARRNVCLRDVGITKNTQQRYYHAVRQVYKVIAQSSTYEEIDEQISQWIEQQFHKGSPINIVADGLSGLHYFLPATKKRLPGSWKLFAIWRKLEVPARAPPITEDLCLAMISRSLQTDELSFAALLGLGFHCFLRTGELLTARPADLLVGQRSGVIRLPASKGGTRHNVQESVSISDPMLLDILRELLLYKRAMRLTQVPIWTHSATRFRKQFQSLVAFFKVEHLKFRCYSLRRGGATAYFQKYGLMEKTLLRGRWASIAVAKLYLCDGLAQLPGLTASPATQALVQSHLQFLFN